MRRTGFPLAALFAFFLIAGTLHAAGEGSFRAPPQFAERMKNVRTIAMLRPDIEIFEISSGGVKELRQEWCDEGCEKVQNAFVAEFQRFGYDIEFLDPPQDDSSELREILFLYDDVVTSVLKHAYNGPNLFPAKKTDFDYTLGPIDNVLQPVGADALLLIHGIDEISSSGRKAMQTLGVLAGAAVGLIAVPNMGRTVVMVALVDRSGDLLWFNIRGGSGGYNLREPESVSKLASQSFAGFREKLK
ncbi:MAG: hypothetical protein P8175_14975 [Deltaproteobacteria bacterium]|jgi:hypothetical protein